MNLRALVYAVIITCSHQVAVANWLHLRSFGWRSLGSSPDRGSEVNIISITLNQMPCLFPVMSSEIAE